MSKSHLGLVNSSIAKTPHTQTARPRSSSCISFSGVGLSRSKGSHCNVNELISGLSYQLSSATQDRFSVKRVQLNHVMLLIFVFEVNNLRRLDLRWLNLRIRHHRNLPALSTRWCQTLTTGCCKTLLSFALQARGPSRCDWGTGNCGWVFAVSEYRGAGGIIVRLREGRRVFVLILESGGLDAFDFADEDWVCEEVGGCEELWGGKERVLVWLVWLGRGREWRMTGRAKREEDKHTTSQTGHFIAFCPPPRLPPPLPPT